MGSTDKHQPVVVYLVGQFPSVSETFILREMTTLESMGFGILPLSMEPASEEVPHEAARPFIRQTLYRPRPLSAVSLGAVLRSLWLRPLGWFSALLLLLRYLLTQPRHGRELISAWLAAHYFASRLQGRQTRHLHAHFATYPATVALFLAEVCGTGFSLSCHAQDILAQRALLLDRKVQEADFVTVCTRMGLDRLVQLGVPGVSGKVHLIHHGIDLSALGRHPHIQYPVPLILSVGRLVEKKGFRFLLQAAAVLAGKGAQFELIIVGDGVEREELERMAGGLGLRDKVTFTGWLTQEELVHVYRRADAFCLASVVAKDGDRDGLPNVILEAMTYGIPVVASSLSAIPEAIIDEETGLLAAPGAPQELAAQLDRVLHDPVLRAHLASRALAKVHTDFDLHANTVRLGSLLAGALGMRHWPTQPLLPDDQ
jgi:glycosyltransferase involved in cell wall biosynthesis